MRHQVHHMGVALHIHDLGNLNSARLRHPPDVVSPQIEQHDVLGTFLLVPSEILLQSLVFCSISPPGACSRDGMGGNHPLLHPYQKLRRGADDIAVVKVEVIHIGRGVDAPQRPIDVEGSGSGSLAKTLRKHCLNDLACSDIFLSLSDPCLEFSPGEIG